MPEITPEGKENIAEHIKRRWLDKLVCPVCKSEDTWVYPDTIVEMREFNFGSFGQSMIPAVVITCHKCGHMLLFNAIHVQAVKPPSRAGAILRELEGQ